MCNIYCLWKATLVSWTRLNVTLYVHCLPPPPGPLFLRSCIVTNFFVIKQTRCTNFTNLFCHETLHVSDSSSVHHQEFFTVRSAMSCRFVDSFRAEPGWNSFLVLLESCLQICMTYTIVECTVNKLLMMDRRTVRNM